MPYTRMALRVTAQGKAPTTLSLQEVQSAVAKALREAGVSVPSSGVQVEGRLSA